jgi:nucleoid DNA-binding protein
MNHTERIAHVARQRRGLTRNLVDEVVDLYLETLATEIAAGEWTDIPGIGKMQVIQEETKGTLKSIVAGGQRETRKPGLRLRTKIRLYEKFKRRCREQPSQSANSL